MIKRILKWINKNFWHLDEFKDCSRGTQIQKYNAYIFNQKNADLLIIPIFHWFLSVLFFYLMVGLTQLIAKNYPFLIYFVALFAILMTVCVIGLTLLTISYVFLNGCNIYWTDNSLRNKDDWFR